MKQPPMNDPARGGRILLDDQTFRFSCAPDVPCFTRCCRDADMYLYPYDIIRLKNRLGLSSDAFLKQHTISALRDNPHFPSLMLRMSDADGRPCPFLSDEGCRVYPDRPFSCRAYPLEPAMARTAETSRGVIYYISRHAHCLGHNQTREWTAREWIQDQEMTPYHEFNARWVEMDTIFRRDPWGARGVESPALKMAFMACFNVDKLREFVFESSFLERFDLPGDRIEAIRESDEERMLFGFDWVKFFLTGRGPLTPREGG
ncbi:MAG: YkgJ family cysteine cluster protein [Desulfobacterales bacterium]|nr:YkgJ family cysteine cluster protein [Desulfobacterales bacterium]